MIKKTLFALLIISALLLSGCKGGITGGAVVCNRPYILVGVECCLDQNDNLVCDKDESEPEAEPVEPPKADLTPVVEVKTEEPVKNEPSLQTNEYYLKVNQPVLFEKKTVKLTAISNVPVLKLTINIDGQERDIEGTKDAQLINGIKVTVLKYLNLENAITAKIENLNLQSGEYLITTRKDLEIPDKGITLHLSDVKDEGKIAVQIIGDSLETLLIEEGKTKTFGTVQITNLDGFESGYKIEQQAIIKVE